jgi:short-subunit dehydrogenase
MNGTQKFNDKLVLISGAGSGIGLELAKEFARCNARVIGTDIDPARVDAMVNMLTQMKCNAKGYVVDHSKHEQVDALFNAITAEFGTIDILCPNAGVGHAGKIGSIPQEEWEWVINVNVWGVLHMVNKFISSMMQRKSGWVLLTASGSAILPSAGMGPYNLSKFAVLGLGETMYMELKLVGIDVSILCPGVIATNIISDGIVHGTLNKQRAEQIYAQGSAKSVHPALVAKAAVAGLAAGKPLILSPLKHMIAGEILKRCSRKLFLNLGARLFKRGSNFVGPVVGDE